MGVGLKLKMWQVPALLFRRTSLLLLILLLKVSGAQGRSWTELFHKQKPLIAALMVPRELATPDEQKRALAWSLEQLQIAKDYGMDGVLFEFRGGEILEPQISPDQFHRMLSIAKALVAQRGSLRIGFEILWHYPEETLRLAHSSGADFIRLDFFSDPMIVKGRHVPIDPEKIVGLKRSLGADSLLLLADIQVKYAQPVFPQDTLEQSARRAAQKGANGLIVTATKSGEAPSVERVQLAGRGRGELPLLIGSGFSEHNAKDLWPEVQGVIVGTSISEKTGGPLIPEKVSRLVAQVRGGYPQHWWRDLRLQKEPAEDWEILSSSVKPPQVILSKRHELGLLSNFAPTPFEFRGQRFASLEGLWQSTKYPENSKDPRWALASWPHSRAQVAQMSGFAAKRAGEFASQIMKKHAIDWVSFQGEKMIYREPGESPFYRLIVEATRAKLAQNPRVAAVLQQTRGLALRPDHHQGQDVPKAWLYHEIAQKLRDEQTRAKPASSGPR